MYISQCLNHGVNVCLCLQGSTVNMNVMQPLYKAIDSTPAYKDMDQYQILGIALFIGEWGGW